jgi:hypothetical protein
MSVAMMVSAPLSFDHASEQVEGMVQQGTAFARVEDAIDATPFSRSHKGALWLLAWSLRDSLVAASRRLADGGSIRLPPLGKEFARCSHSPGESEYCRSRLALQPESSSPSPEVHPTALRAPRGVGRTDLVLTAGLVRGSCRRYPTGQVASSLCD